MNFLLRPDVATKNTEYVGYDGCQEVMMKW